MRSVSKVETTGHEIPLSIRDADGGLSALWVSWNAHRRTTGLCAAWDLPLHVIHSQRKGLARRIEQTLRTLGLLRQRRPSVLFVQNPSLALTVLAVLSRGTFGYYLVVDAHNEGVRPFARRGRLVHWLTRRLLRGADATIVTNGALVKDVDAAGGRALVLPDRLPEPEWPGSHAAASEEVADIVVISSFMSDEPVGEIVAAATSLPGVRFAFTGDARRFHGREIELPPNVRLTGYLPDKAFWKLLSQAAVICDLTLKPDCLVCGAYEALALAKPMVLSDNPATRELFGRAAVLTNNEAADIARAVRTAIDERDRLAANARVLREQYGAPWHLQAATAWESIRSAAQVTRRGLA
jgi:glycosyltransferase involved in cell wall biosynthesis